MKYSKIIEPANGKELDQTLIEMNRLVKVSSGHYEFVNFVKKTFGSLTGSHLFKAVWNYTRKNFKYINDELDEVLTAPYKMLLIKKGDCDDFSIFIKTVLEIKKEKCFFMLLGRSNSDFSHVAIITENGTVIDATNNTFDEIPDFLSKQSKVIFKG